MENRQITQNEHDYIVAASATTYSGLVQQGYQVTTNPNSTKNRWVGSDSCYPDVIIWKPDMPGSTFGKAIVIEEIETADSVNDSESEQWRTYSEIGTLFRLIVPFETISIATGIIRRNNIRVGELWYYYLDGNSQIRFAQAVL